MAVISIFKNVHDTTQGVDIPIEIALDQIQNGKYQDLVFPIRTETDKAKRNELKKKLPALTISGRFNTRNAKDIIEHSGYIAIDIDNLSPEEMAAARRGLSADKYAVAIFTSCSGRGLCLIFKIDPAKHEEAFYSLEEYIFQNYRLIVDPSGKDVSRLRYVSYDPFMLTNYNAARFTKYGKNGPVGAKGRPSGKAAPAIVFAEDDYYNIIETAVNRKIDLTDGYRNWRNLGFALADKFGEAGREDFHLLSSINNKYTAKETDVQYDRCLNAGKSGITIATLYYYARQAGIPTMSERTKSVAKAAAENKQARATIDSTVANIAKFSDETDTVYIRDIVEQVFAQDIKIEGTSDIEAGRIWIRAKELKKNLITNQIERSNGQPLTDTDQNSLELEMKEALDIDYATITKLLNSDAIPGYHAIFDFFKKYEDRSGEGSIARLAACLESDMTWEYVEQMLTKFLVGLIACAHNQPSPMMLILSGKIQGSGKTSFWRLLLPPELRHLCAVKDFSQLTNESFRRDLEISFSKYWLIFDDEMSGKSKRDHRTIKSLLSMQFSNHRAAYGRHDEARQRIAAVGGTTNDSDIIPDHGDNRRLVPIQINKIRIEEKDFIDPVDYIMEAYHLFKDGYKYELLGSDIKYLTEHTENFKILNAEDEMLPTYYGKADGKNDPRAVYITATEMVNEMERDTKTRLDRSRVGRAAQALGIDQENRRINGIYGRYYHVVRLRTAFTPGQAPNREEQIKNLPF